MKIKLFVALVILKKVKLVINGKCILYLKPLTAFRIIIGCHLLRELCFEFKVMGLLGFIL